VTEVEDQEQEEHHIRTALTRCGYPDWSINQVKSQMSPLFDQERLQLVDVTNLAAVHTLLQHPLNLVVDWVKVRTVGWPQSWSDEVRCFVI